MTSAIEGGLPNAHRGHEGAGDRPRGFSPSFPLVDAKLHPPAPRPDTIHRARVAAQLTADPQLPVIAIVAPPGYGKTTVLAEWSRTAERDVAWLTIDDVDNEPSVLLSYIAVAIDRIEPIDGSLASLLSVSGPRILGAAVPRLASELYRWPRPGLLVLDDVHRLVDRTCLDAVTMLLESLPDRFRVAIAARTVPDLPLARMRARRTLLEIGRADLAFDAEETERVVRAVGHRLSTEQAHELTGRTEGWPAAIYLAALAHRLAPGAALSEVSVREGYLADFIRSELQPALDDVDLAVLTRTSILDVVETAAAAPIADVASASERLEALASGNGLIVRVGGGRPAYRYHQLFRDYLRAELDRREPDIVPLLHRRAAAWFAGAGRLEEAIEHSIAGRDTDVTARLVEQAFLATYYGGHADRLLRWMQTFDEQDLERRPSLAVLGAWVHAVSGRPEHADRMADIAERSTSSEEPVEGAASFGAVRAILRAAMARHGPDEMLQQATLATESEGASGPWRATALWVLGGAHVVRGDVDTADEILAEAVATAPTVGTSGFYPLALRASLAMARGDWRTAEQLARESHAAFARTHLSGVVSALMVHAVTARVAIRQGDLARGRTELVRAQLGRSLASYALPWASVLSLTEMAHAYLAVGDPAGARSVVSSAELIMRRRPRLGVIPAAVQELRRRLEASARMDMGPSTLTPAELRVLPFLSTHLTFEEIGDRLSVSRHTVKTHSLAIYGKLGASNRSEAVRLAVEIGLLEPFFGLRLIKPGG